MKKALILVLIIIVSYLLFKLISYCVFEAKISYDTKKPIIKLSQFVNISEKRVKYSQTYYINNDFVGFNAYIDQKYFLTVTKLGKIATDYRIDKTIKKPDESTNLNLFSVSDIEDQNGRYIDLNRYPLKIEKINYYLEGEINNINQSGFYEIEAVFSFFNISFNSENQKDFGYVGFKSSQSISFIRYKDDLFVLNLLPIKKIHYKSLHDLSDIPTL